MPEFLDRESPCVHAGEDVKNVTSDRLDRIEATIEALAESQVQAQAEWRERADRDRAEWQERMVRIEAQQAANDRQIAANFEQIALSREDINGLKASILELRNLAADFLRNQRENQC